MLALIILGVVVLVIAYFIRQFIGAIFGLYRIVPVNEAHIRVMGNTKKIFSARTKSSAYWIIPFMTKLHKLPLCNLSIPVNDVKLNDKNMAKFVCDIMCFINIANMELAVERLSLTDASREMGFDFQKLSEDLRAIMESVGRTVTTKQTILDIYMNRSMLDQAITKEVEMVFPKWGIELVDLELKDIKDAPQSSIIHDIEVIRAAEITRDAAIKVAQTTKEAEIAKAENEEIYRKRQIEKDKAIGVAAQSMASDIATQQKIANEKAIEAERTLMVGKASIEKEKVEQQAQAQRIKSTTESEGQASQIMQVGQAEADIVKIKKFAEAEGTLKLAEAMKAFNDTAVSVKVLDIHKEITIKKFEALAAALSKADIKLIMSGANSQNLFGLNLDAEGGANLNQFLKESDIGSAIPQIQKLIESLKEKK